METSIFEIPPSMQNKLSSLLQVAAYCRVSTDHEEQDSSIELQILHYDRLIAQTPDWVNVGIYAERVSGLNIKERTEFKKLMAKCRRGKVDLILTKSISRVGRNTLELQFFKMYLQVVADGKGIFRSVSKKFSKKIILPKLDRIFKTNFPTTCRE